MHIEDIYIYHIIHIIYIQYISCLKTQTRTERARRRQGEDRCVVCLTFQTFFGQPLRGHSRIFSAAAGQPVPTQSGRRMQICKTKHHNTLANTHAKQNQKLLYNKENGRTLRGRSFVLNKRRKKI